MSLANQLVEEGLATAETNADSSSKKETLKTVGIIGAIGLTLAGGAKFVMDRNKDSKAKKSAAEKVINPNELDVSALDASSGRTIEASLVPRTTELG